jgi:hypothetical protein
VEVCSSRRAADPPLYIQWHNDMRWDLTKFIMCASDFGL